MITKHNHEAMDVLLDFHLEPDEAITGITGTASPVDELEVSCVVLNRDDVRIVLRRGAIGGTYAVTVTASTSHSRTISKIIEVTVIADLTFPLPSGDLSLDGVRAEIEALHEADANIVSLINNHLDTQTVAIVQMATNVIRMQTIMVEGCNNSGASA